MSPAADAVIRRLDSTRQQWWFFTLLSTSVLAVAASLGLLLLLMLSDSFLVFSQIALGCLFGLWLIATLALIVVVIRRMVHSHRSLEATARRVQEEIPELGSNLMIVLQLSKDTQNTNRAFCDAAVTSAAQSVSGVALEEAARRESRWRRFRYCMQTPRDFGESLGLLGFTIVAAIACHLLLPNWGSAANRLLTPWEFKPSVGRVKIVKVTPGNTQVLAGSSMEVSAEIENADKVPYKATLLATVEGDKETAVPMGPDPKEAERKIFKTYKATVPAITKPLKYRLEIGDSQSDVFAVAIVDKPTIQDVEVVLHYPEYLAKPSDRFSQKTPDLEAPQYTVAELRIRPSTPISKGFVQLDGNTFNGTVEDNGAVLVVKVPMLRDASFTVTMVNAAGNADPNPRVNHIRVLPDAPPAVQILKPNRQSTAAPKASVDVSIRASDDHALGKVRLEMSIEKPPAEEGADGEAGKATLVQSPTSVNEWLSFEGSASSAVLPYKLDLSSDKIQSGCVVKIRAVAWDKRDFSDYGLTLKPQETASDWHTIRIVSEEAQKSAALEQIDNIRTSVWKIYESQVRAKMKTMGIPKREKLEDQVAISAETRLTQVDLQKKTATLADSIVKPEKEDLRTIKNVLTNVSTGEMVEAVRRCDTLVKAKTNEEFAQPVQAVVETQDKVIDLLARLLDVARKAESKALTEAGKHAANELPPDVKAKFEEAKAKIEDFLKQQKKVVDTTAELAKKPVEDFTEKDEQALKSLAKAEDDLSKFMQDLHSDLSKLPDQDFANAAQAKELVEVQTELKMAEDALLKKSSDIAVPLEQLGYEKAEQLKADMEKWLPDEPDRAKWSQEEAISDKDKESPLAELPSELEDLIGELAEQEEDLMDEAQDVSSSAIDTPSSVGWDASDGTISSNAAKGVTGNQLPGTNEVGGRSGEGRSAKSSGEFVGDEAVGKGGRKTPSRLTPDPYQKGQIKDHSKDPEGGATGGGKESGEGGEGLEGPTHRDPGHREMQRLAGKQAALRNKAEGIDVQMQVARYHHTDWEKLKETMSQVEDDLKAGRYQNVLRQRKVMAERLGNVKQYLEGEFQVKQDTTANLPKEIQKEILGSMSEASPVGWEEINRDYFERLSGSKTGAALNVKKE